jgi:hypothetical protein
MRRARQPNGALRRLLAEVGWTEDFLAGRVNAVAADSGVDMRLDRRSVSHWLAGRHPRPPVPEFIAEAFARELGREITPTDIGLGPQNRPSSTLAGSAPDAVATLDRLARIAADRRGPPSEAYSLAALAAAPPWRRAAERGVILDPDAPPPVPADPQQVAATEQMARLFSDVDTAFGGGYARRALAAYLAYDVGPRLRKSIRPYLRRRILSAATQLTYLCGFMCYDDQEHTLAQRYYLTAMDLATENNDPAAYAVTLRALSVQARDLGHPQQAVHLAETAAATARKADPMLRAFLLGQLAVAAAATDSRALALSTLGAAERSLDRITSQANPKRSADEPMGGYHPSALAHQQAAVLALLRDQEGAITALSDSIRHRPPHERRSRAITCAELAQLQSRRGHLEQAIVTWHQFLDDYPYLTSGRATTALQTLRARLRPHAAHPRVRHLLMRASSI